MKKLETAPTLEPLSLSEVKEQLRLESDYDREDTYLSGLIAATRAMVERVCNRALITQEWTAFFSSWCELQAAYFPLGQLQAVVSLVYLDNSGIEHTVSTDDYAVIGAGTDEGRVIFPSDFGFSFPSDLYFYEPIKVRFRCGYGDTHESVPEDLKQAMKLIVAHLWENREPLKAGSVEHLLEGHRLRDVF